MGALLYECVPNRTRTSAAENHLPSPRCAHLNRCPASFARKPCSECCPPQPRTGAQSGRVRKWGDPPTSDVGCGCGRVCLPDPLSFWGGPGSFSRAALISRFGEGLWGQNTWFWGAGSSLLSTQQRFCHGLRSLLSLWGPPSSLQDRSLSFQKPNSRNSTSSLQAVFCS